MRYFLSLLLLLVLTISCGTQSVTEPDPVQTSFTMRTGDIAITYYDPAWFLVNQDGVITEDEQITLENEGYPVIFFEVGNKTYEWNFDVAVAKRSAQVLDQIPNPPFYEDFPLELRGTEMYPKEQLSYHSAQMIDDTFDWEYVHPWYPEIDACTIYIQLQGILYIMDSDTGYFAKYFTDTLETGRFGMYCPPDAHPEIWCGWDMPPTSFIYGEYIDTVACPPYSWL